MDAAAGTERIDLFETEVAVVAESSSSLPPEEGKKSSPTIGGDASPRNRGAAEGAACARAE